MSLSLAKDVARCADWGTKHYLLGAVCKRRDGVMVASANGSTAIPDSRVHAEARVLRKAGYRAKLYIARVDRLGNTRLAKPCQACKILIRNMRVEVCYYTIDNDTYGMWVP